MRKAEKLIFAIVVIMTSNLGAMYDFDSNKNDKDDDDETKEKEMRQVHLDAVRRHFAPEFVNRIDEIIVFNRLKMEHMRPICDIQMREVQALINQDGNNVLLNVTDAAKDYLAQMGYSKQYGARPLKRCIQSMVLKPLAVSILDGRIKDNSIVDIDYDFNEDKLRFAFKNLDEPAVIV